MIAVPLPESVLSYAHNADDGQPALPISSASCLPLTPPSDDLFSIHFPLFTRAVTNNLPKIKR